MFTDTEPVAERRERTESDGTAARDRSAFRRRVRRGAEGGALATLVMTAYRLPVKRTLPPTAEFWTKYASGGDPEDHPVVALVLHAVYGVAAGALFATLFPSRKPVATDAGDRGPPSPSGELSTTLLGLGYGIALSVVGERVVMGALLDIEPDDRFVFHVGHVIYGIALGSWVGTRTRDR